MGTTHGEFVGWEEEVEHHESLIPKFLSPSDGLIPVKISCLFLRVYISLLLVAFKHFLVKEKYQVLNRSY